jgi:hypothetical protein
MSTLSLPVPRHHSLGDVVAALGASDAFARLPLTSQREVSDSLAKIADYLSPRATAGALMDLSSLRRGGGGGGDAPAPTGPSAPGPAAQPKSPAPAGGGAAGGGAPAGGAPSGAVSRVGDVTKATLSAIDFPSFVASLIQGTFQAIVDASIQQMEAYAELLKNAAQTVDSFMKDNVTDATARDYLADRYDGVFERDTSGDRPKLRVRSDASAKPELPSFFKDLGLDTPDSLDDQTVEEQVVPAARQMLAERRQQTLATMVLMGINRVIVDTGEISAKLQFHVDASESTAMRFDQQKTSGMNMSSSAGRNPFSAQGIMVGTTSLNAQSNINVRADLVGNVVVRFRSDVLPLERFADSAAIQLINTRAKVPTPAAATAAPGAQPEAARGAAPAAAPPAPPAPPPAAPRAAPPASAPVPAAAPAPAAQSLYDDPWSARA